ncbi:DUF350 domain-containing protein [Oceanobacillus caeni]|uniref:DUF350 domain-containing protein n=1 Tax=Oceanobacillus caeni TaxID=405946 RepID=UPI002E1BA481|nr:DUF350 domain-containing protein [Oceanobacillus caeni]
MAFYLFSCCISFYNEALFIFENITRKYKDYEEIKNGNVAVALSVAGKILGICLILAFAIYNSAHIYDTIIWGLVGVVLQMAVYVIVELLTRTFSMEEQLKNNNIAVGILSMSVSIGLGFVVGASIT